MFFRADRPAPGSVARFEQSLGLPLPRDYESFLEGFNGGRPACQFRFVPELDGVVEIDILFGIGLGEEFNIEIWTARYADELPAGTLVIGSDPLGNLFTLDLAGGGVYYWDHIRQYERSDDAENVFIISPNIDKFLEDEVDADEPLLSNLVGPNGPKTPENIWYKTGENTLEEIDRAVFVDEMHLPGYRIATPVS
jgi:hypothetical protein